MPDLWPVDLDLAPSVDEDAPVALLREQARHLKNRTNGQIEGFVSTDKWETDFLHSFFLVVPVLDNYSYLLLTVIHSLPFYPVTVRAPVMEKEFKAEDREQLEDVLRQVFSSPETKRVIWVLRTQIPPGTE
jgi:hypothetical protein